MDLFVVQCEATEAVAAGVVPWRRRSCSSCRRRRTKLIPCSSDTATSDSATLAVLLPRIGGREGISRSVSDMGHDFARVEGYERKWAKSFSQHTVWGCRQCRWMPRRKLNLIKDILKPLRTTPCVPYEWSERKHDRILIPPRHFWQNMPAEHRKALEKFSKIAPEEMKERRKELCESTRLKKMTKRARILWRRKKAREKRLKRGIEPRKVLWRKPTWVKKKAMKS